jgi:hypothetical protein
VDLKGRPRPAFLLDPNGSLKEYRENRATPIAQLCGSAIDFVIKQYRSDKGKGWGALAKSLGIKPGSAEFHALKNGHDLYDDTDLGGDKGKGKSKGKGQKQK